MGLERFDIVLDQATSADVPTFSAGQMVTGSVVAWLHEKETVYSTYSEFKSNKHRRDQHLCKVGLHLEADGRAKVRWSEGSSDDSTTHTSKQRYFRNRIHLDRQPSK